MARLAGPTRARPDGGSRPQRDFLAAEAFAPAPEPPPDDFDDDFALAPDDFALAPEDDGRDFVEAPEDDRSAPDDFARPPDVDDEDDDDLALGREDFLAAVAFGVEDSVSFTPSMTRAPALATASAPSATVSPMDRSASPACRRAPVAAFFTDLVAALAVRLVVPLLLFFA